MPTLEELEAESDEILSKIEELCDDEALKKEASQYFEQSPELRGILKVYELDEAVILNPISVYQALEGKKLSPKAQELVKLAHELEDVNHSLAAKQRPHFKTESDDAE